VIEAWDDQLKPKRGPGDRYCPSCGAERPSGARFCASCGRSFGPTTSDVTPPTPAVAPAEPETDRTALTIAGVSWLIAAALTGYLALEQFQLVNVARLLGYDTSQLTGTAAINAIAAVVTVFFGIRLLLRPSASILGWSIVWSIIDIVGGAYQASQGIGDAAFLGSIIAAGVAGIASFVARQELPTPEASDDELDRAPAARPMPPVVQPPVPALERPSTPVPAAASRSGRAQLAIGAGVVLAFIAIAILAWALVSGQVAVAPSAAPTATPTQRAGPTPFAFDPRVSPGPITMSKPTYKVGKTTTAIEWTMSPSQLPPTGSLLMSVYQGTELVDSATLPADATRPGVSITSTLTGYSPGTYRIEVTSSGYVLARGTFTLVK